MLRPRPLIALGVALVAAAWATPAVAAPLASVPANASLLFTLDADRGRLVGSGADMRLTLTGVDRSVTWFTDRPDRDAGQARTSRLVDAWDDLGFTRVPPNAALVLQRAPGRRDTVAIELRRPVYDPVRRTLRLSVRALPGLDGRLSRLDARVDRRIARRFGESTLFIDNASSYAWGGCNIGQPQLMAFDQPPYAMLPADGRTVPLRQSEALGSFYGPRFGGELPTSFGLPALAPPVAGTGWFVCASGNFPAPGNMGDCEGGEVDLWFMPPWWRGESTDPWLPADGRQAGPNRRAPLGSRQPYVTLPKLDAPEGMTWMVCVGSYRSDGASLGQLELFMAEPPDDGRDWLPADGRTLRVADHMALDAVLNGLRGDRERFKLPDVPSPAPGLRYYIAVNGTWPWSGT